MTNDRVSLDPGEELIWSGRPDAVWFAIRRAWWPLLIAIALLTISVTLSLKLGRLPSPADPTDPVAIARGLQGMSASFGLIGVLAALWLWLRALRTRYMLTNRRVVIDTAGVLPRRTSMPLEHIRFVEFRSKLLGPDDVVFNETRRPSLDGWGRRGEGFIAVPDAARVEQLIRDAIDQTLTTRAREPWR